MEKKFNEEVYRNGSEVVCDACGSVIKHINVKARIIARQAEGFNVTEQYFACQECGKKYTVLIVDHEMQFLIQKRQQVERQIKLHRQIRSRAQTIQRLVTKIEKIKKQQEEKAASEQIEGQMTLDDEGQLADDDEDIEEAEDDADNQDKEEWEDAHPESITSLCYSCQRYSECNVKTGTCQSCDQYVNKAEAEKTEEERYNEEQDAIDRETAKKLREKADEEKMQQLPSQQEKKVHDVKLGTTFFDDVKTGRKTFELRKNDRGYKEGDIIVMHEYKDGTTTGRTIEKKIVYMLEDFTGLEDGYCILGLGEVKAGEE